MKFIEGTKVSLDYDTGVVLTTNEDGSKAIILWDSDGEKEEWDAETFFTKGGGSIVESDKEKNTKEEPYLLQDEELGEIEKKTYIEYDL